MVLHAFNVVAESARGESGAFGHPELGPDLVVGEQRCPLDFHRSDLIADAFGNRDDDSDPFLGEFLKFDVQDLEIDVALFAVEFGELLLVVLKLLLLEHAAAGDPGEHPAPTGFHLLAQFSVLEGVGSDELDFLDADLAAFFDAEGHRGATGGLGDAGDIFDLGLLIAGFLIHLQNGAGVGEELLFVIMLSHLGGDFSQQFPVAVLIVALEIDVGQERFALHPIFQRDAIGRQGRLGADIVEVAGAVEAANVVIDRGLAERVANLDADVGADQFVADCGRPDMFDVDGFDLARILSERGGDRPESNGGEGGDAADFESHSVYRFGGRSLSSMSILLSYLVKPFRNVSRTSPVGPFRCLAISRLTLSPSVGSAGASPSSSSPPELGL